MNARRPIRAQLFGRVIRHNRAQLQQQKWAAQGAKIGGRRQGHANKKCESWHGCIKGTMSVLDDRLQAIGEERAQQWVLETHSAKAWSSIASSPGGNFTVRSDPQPKKAHGGTASIRVHPESSTVLRGRACTVVNGRDYAQ